MAEKYSDISCATAPKKESDSSLTRSPTTGWLAFGCWPSQSSAVSASACATMVSAPTGLFRMVCLTLSSSHTADAPVTVGV